MGLGKATVFAGTLAGIMLACLSQAHPAAAQEDAPRAALSRERIMAEILGLGPAGEPVVSAETARGEVFLTTPLRLREEGRLAADIATVSLRMAAGAPVSHREFKPRAFDQSEAIQAWCGPGEQRTMFGWSGGITVCMVHTADGKANLGTPQMAIGSWWMANNVTFMSPDTRTERVAVEPVETPSAFNLVFVYERLRSNGVAIHAAIEGPGSSATARPYRYDMARRILPVTDGVAELDYDGLKLTLTPRQQGGVLSSASERVAAPLDLNALRARAMAAAAEEIGEPPAEGIDQPAPAAPETQGLAPTPFVIGGVKLDPTTLTVGEGVVGRNGVVLSGPAQYAVTTRLAQPINLRATFVNDVVPVGVVLHQVEFADRSALGTRTMTRIWCGPLGRPTVFRPSERVAMCLRRAQFGGWEAFWPSTGRVWLGTTRATGVIATLQATGFQPDPSPTSVLEPLTVRAEIQRITDDAVTLRIFARLKDEDALILTVTPKFDNGRATVAFWTHRLVLTRSGEGVTATFSPDGDGEGPSDEGVYP